MDLSIIVVSYNSEANILSCLNSIFEADHEELTFETIVVENGSTDNSVALIDSQFPQVKLIKNSTNLGYAKANNQAAQLAHGRDFFLLNPDTRVRRDTLQILGRELAKRPRTGVIGGKLIDLTTGEEQKNGRNLPTLTREILFYSGLPQLSQLAAQAVVAHFDFAQINHTLPTPVPSVSGAGMLVRGELYHKIGLFDERFFLYYEDYDLCKRAWQANWEVWYIPELIIDHQQGASSRQNPWWAHYWLRRSAVGYAKKWYPGWQAKLLQAYLAPTIIFSQWMAWRKNLGNQLKTAN